MARITNYMKSIQEISSRFLTSIKTRFDQVYLSEVIFLLQAENLIDAQMNYTVLLLMHVKLCNEVNSVI